MMETVSIKLEEDFARLVEKVMKRHHYATKTEFIREAIREKIAELEVTDRNLRAISLSSKRKTSDEDLHKAGEKAVEELERAFQ